MKKLFGILLSVAILASVAGCTIKDDAQTGNQSENKSDITSEATDLKEGNYDLSFTNNDCDSSYDESSACKIEFSNSTVTSSSANGASVNGSEVIISKEGTYILTGKASDGAVIVDAGDNDKIQIVLNGLDLTSSKSPFIIKNADKVFLTLAKKSENTLSDASSYELTVDD